ncbi:YsnF/AvaK domain-containing protein [Erythrobacter sp. NFXS35]|uniref:YsnF/AvaK domain-containing protein n=1 Tax=Erythrobacter sp. NFXS35 TaxID=2818436 RepID=UPI0032E028DE
MRHDKRYENLDALGDWKLEHSSQDIRGKPLVSPEGHQFGIIDDLLVDRQSERVAAVRLEDGRVTPVEPLDIHDNCVVYGEEARRHADRGVTEGHVVDEEVVPVVEERVAVGKRVADRGRQINVRTNVVTGTVSEDVELRQENVSVDKRPVENRRVSAADADAMLEGKTVSMTERSEEAVVAKDAVVTDEVVVRKTADDKVEHVEETVRKTEVDVDTDRTGSNVNKDHRRT